MSDAAQKRINSAIDHIYRLGAGALLALIAWLGSSLREEVEKNTTAIHAVEKQLTDVHHVERRLTLLEAKEEADTRRLTERVRLLELELAKKN